MPDQLQRRLAEIGAPADVRALAAELAEQTVRDPLTGLYNRRFFNEALAQNIETARRYGRELSLVIFDLDGFKTVNDTCGHQAGDEVLKTFAQLLQKTARKADIVCRIGGDEFAVILPEAELSDSRKFAERFFLVLEKTGSAKASAGTAALPSDNLFADADAALLAAKKSR
ncbi:MAG: GGDEF domain-containing protein [Kiritimatiellales bacterium]|jgi:diguanylate cyclase (GGDEF)-like protein